MKRFIVCLLSLLLIISAFSASAELADDIQKLISCASDGMSMQDWIDGPLTQGAGSATDNYIINLNRSGQRYDLSKYTSAALNALKVNNISNPVSRQRCALAVVSCGLTNQLPENIADETIGKLGVMSYVYGLHLLNNGVSSVAWTQNSIVEKLLELQKADGGWAVMGNYGDVDVTSMCLQALSACDENDIITPAAERAISFLSGVQLENGGFSGMGLENSESTAQVIVALASLGVDVKSDDRFIKNGTSVYDALMAYQLPSGGFAHHPGDTHENATASVQALQALSALTQTGTAYFDFGSIADQPESDSENAVSWKQWALIIIAAFAVIGSIWALTRRHGRIKQLIFVMIVCCAAAALVCYINVETKTSYYRADDSADVSGEVYFSIRCDTVAGYSDDGSTPANGIILERTALPYSEGDTVFDILTDAVRRFEIHMEYQGGTEEMAYINGINNLYEYIYGDLSGWVYTVNGDQVSVGCGSCPVKAGDEIIWHYTTKLGEDIK